jgi:hypothetical protein
MKEKTTRTCGLFFLSWAVFGVTGKETRSTSLLPSENGTGILYT